MTPDIVARMTTVTTVLVFLYVAHVVADHWIQTNDQAGRKGLPTWAGRLACARHVATLTATKLAALTAMGWVTGWRPAHVVALTAGLTVDALSHYWADRRTTLAKLAEWVERAGINGKTTFLTLGTPRPGHDDNPSLGTGGYALDQAFHLGFLAVAALIAAL